MAAEKKECRTCVNFNTRQGVGKIGNCQAHPKVAVTNHAGLVSWHYPPTKPTGWCGEHHRHPDLVKYIQPPLFGFPGEF